jgi:hypothetical protein
MGNCPVERPIQLRKTLLDGTQRKIFYQLIVVWCGLLFQVACNPFAPSLDEAIVDRNKLLGDRTKIDGFFEFFRNAYEMRDSSLYGQLITQDFRFTYFDFQTNRETYWDRDTEMQSAYNMFRQVKSATIQWTNYIYIDTVSFDTIATVERAFNLTIVQNEQQILRGTGNANFTLVRTAKGMPWRAKQWYDKSDF